MINPITTEMIVRMNTPDALMSFIAFISGIISLLVISHICSIAVLNISALNTMPIQSKMLTHSKAFKLSPIPRQSTNIAMKKCILKFISVDHTDLSPAIANLKLDNLEIFKFVSSK
jgi:hypothetical protein